MLIPVLTIAGLGASIAPIAMMTSCGNGNKDKAVGAIGLTLNDDQTAYVSSGIEATLEGDKAYTCICSIEAEKVLPKIFEVIKEDTTLQMPIFWFKIYQKNTKTSEYEYVTDQIGILYSKSSPSVSFKNDLVSGNYKFEFKLETQIEFIKDSTPIYIGMTASK